MRLYISEAPGVQGPAVALDDMFLTAELPSTAGSMMLDGYMSPFEAAVIERLREAGFAVAGKVNVGEFAIDLLGETSYYGACVREDGTLTDAGAELLASDPQIDAVIRLDVNGAPRRAAALGGCVFVKPTYGTVSRYGTVPVACSGETVGVMARDVSGCRAVLSAIAGHDDRDGTSLPDEQCALPDAPRAAVKKVAVASGLRAAAGAQMQGKVDAFRRLLEEQGVQTAEVDDKILLSARAAWNVLMSAELCNNVSRYDSVKFGYRSKNYSNIDELYTNSRTESFGELLKAAVLFGSDVLATGKYEKMYDKSLRVRRVISEAFAKLFEEYDAVLAPACSGPYTQAGLGKFAAYEENLWTAPASITGLPVVVAGGVQLIGRAFSENSLLDLAQACGKERSV